MPPEPSSFSIPSHSTRPISTPFVSTSSAPVTLLVNNSGRTEEVEQRPSCLDHESKMLDHFTTHLPPPSSSLTQPIHLRQIPDAFTPRIVTFHRPASQGESLPSSTDRARRSPPPTYFPKMDVSTTPARHTLHVQLPNTIETEMITISANKGDKLKVLADAWNMQSDCHYEWQICFAPHDVDLAAVQARFERSGHLTIDVRRTMGNVVVF